jgi:hypothetical protein
MLTFENITESIYLFFCCSVQTQKTQETWKTPQTYQMHEYEWETPQTYHSYHTCQMDEYEWETPQARQIQQERRARKIQQIQQILHEQRIKSKIPPKIVERFYDFEKHGQLKNPKPFYSYMREKHICK